MYREILVGYDDSDQAKDALALGKQLADATGARLVVAGVFQFDPIWGGRDTFRDAETEMARKIEAAASAVGAEAEATPSSSPARGLHELAEEIGADLILIGSAHHGRMGQILAGSVAIALLHGSPCAVGVAPRGYREHAGEDIAAIVVGFDGSAEAGLALTAASGLALDTGAKLKLVSVIQPPVVGAGLGTTAGWAELKAAVEAQAREQLTEARDAVPGGIEVEATLASGDPVKALIEVAAATGTLVLVGSRGYGPLRRVLLGSVSSRLVRSAPCPLIVTPRGVHETDVSTQRAELEAAQ